MTEPDFESGQSTPDRGYILNTGLYNFLKFIAQILLPALGTLYFTLASIWGLPAAEEVVGTITAVDAFLGVFLLVGEKSYDSSEAKYDGSLDVSHPDEETTTLKFNMDPAVAVTQKQMVFKVNVSS